MVKRSIAAALLMVMMAWAEMSLAPMLMMHVGFFPPARAMAQNMAEHHHVMPAGHPCCPKVSKVENVASLEFVAGSLPCQNQHRCCFLQGPQNVPAPVNTENKIAQEIVLPEAAELNPVLSESGISSVKSVAPGPPPGTFGTVLRI